MKTFNEYSSEKELAETSLIGKGYGLLQRSEFERKKGRLLTASNQMKEAAIDAKIQKDTSKKLDYIANALRLQAVALSIWAEMGSNLINTSLAGIIDSPDLKKALQDALKAR